ncbi:polysaccharide biosynthesis tyrosine autokinase [Bradyrhizobium sp. CIAT3101]|uniref:polysaccharide biosynthesis tyrosine autokinase n=1 Tax=Bradyrhizobium sp. CIAT3101 TaxID=439387 RepID=UPI0024B0D3B4|nr:polysaccharide biosynthesis tyrosine autokinase [Bradyrhizobium sp. CIAT3101]WFU79131.1 polysaccharide biosynthesis tyrosine autokinase [Bradyrhizobium sp. CIAT3101]
MLHVSKNHQVSPFDTESSDFHSSSGSSAQYIQMVLGFLRRQAWVLGLAGLLAVITTGLYLLVAPPSYKATATVGIDTTKFQLFQPAGELIIDTSSAVESQLEILKSEKLALEVIKKLHLADDVPSPQGGLFGSSRQPTEFEYTRQLVAVLQKHLTVKRLGIAWIIEISYESRDPEQAARFANAFADAYITDQLDSKYQATRQASTWLEGRVKETREQTLTAQRAVVEFKAKNNIVDTGGRLMSEQQLTELNSQLLTARGQTSEAKARLERVNAVVQSALSADNSNALVTDVPINETIAKLRAQLIDLTTKEREWSAKFGSDHLAVINLHNQARQVRSGMVDELRRVGEAFKSDYDLALRKEKGLETEVAQAVSQSESSSRNQVKLRELESVATSTKELYDNLNKRYLESVEQKSFPVTEARVITRAAPALEREFKTPLKIAVAVLGVGISLGFAIAFVREFTDNVFRSVGQIERKLHKDCITPVPLWKEEIDSNPARPLPTVAGERRLVRSKGPAWASIESPLSSHAEAMRSIKLSIDLNCPGKGAKVIGMTSSLPREGKSTVAASLALTIAAAGAKVMLLDFDLRNPALTRTLASQANVGFLDVISGRTPLTEAIWSDHTKYLSFLPTITNGLFVQSNEIMGAQLTKTFIDKLREEYAYIIVDLPPLAPVIDAKATTHLIDAYLFVVEWGATKVDVVEHALGRAPGISENTLGVILNKVDMDKLHKYDGETRTYYVNKHYSQYGYTH